MAKHHPALCPQIGTAVQRSVFDQLASGPWASSLKSPGLTTASASPTGTRTRGRALGETTLLSKTGWLRTQAGLIRVEREARVRWKRSAPPPPITSRDKDLGAAGGRWGCTHHRGLSLRPVPSSGRHTGLHMPPSEGTHRLLSRGVQALARPPGLLFPVLRGKRRRQGRVSGPGTLGRGGVVGARRGVERRGPGRAWGAGHGAPDLQGRPGSDHRRVGPAWVTRAEPRPAQLRVRLRVPREGRRR